MIKRTLLALLFLAACLSLIGCASGRVKKESQKAVIKAVLIEDYKVELKIDGPFTYTVYKAADPFTVVTELPGVDTKGISDSFASDKAGVTEVRVSKTESPSLLAKVEVLLSSPSVVVPEFTGNSLILRVNKEEPAEPAEEAELPVAEALAIKNENLEVPIAAGGGDLEFPEDEDEEDEEAEEIAEGASISPAKEITSIDFDFKNGSVLAAIKGDGSMQPAIFSLKNRLVVDVPGVSMKASLPDKVISPVKAVRYGMHKDKVRIVFDMKEDAKFTTELVANKVIISFPVAAAPAAPAPPVAAAPAAVKETPAEKSEEPAKLPGAPVAAITPPAVAPAEEAKEEVLEKAPVAPEKKLISLDFQNADVVPIFRFLGDVAGYNVVIHPQVSGKITLKLLSVPWDQALDIVLEIAGFDKKIDKENKLITIASSDTFAKFKQEKAKLKEVEMKVAEPVQEIVMLKHIEAGEMKTRIDEAKVKSCANPIRIDDRLNALIILDTPDCISKVKEEVIHWDTSEHQTMQVLIEAKLVEVTSEVSQQFGIKWGGTAQEGAFILPNKVSSDFSVNTPVLTAGSAEDVAGMGLKVGYADTLSVDLSLEALETMGKTKKLSNPKVLTLDKQAASIIQGTTIYVPVTTAAGTTFQQIAASTNLNITPTIKRHNNVELTVTASRNTPGAPVAGNVAVDQNTVTTKALVKDGETLVLGGIFTRDETTGESGVPILSKIPLLGWLFKTKSTGESTRELLVFITPRIVK